MDHAVGKWRIGGRNPDATIDEIAIMATVKEGQLLGPTRHLVPGSGEICVAVAMPVGGQRDLLPGLTDANARRIVACVNALDGIPIEAIEDFAASGSLGEFWKRGVEDGARRN